MERIKKILQHKAAFQVFLLSMIFVLTIVMMLGGCSYGPRERCMNGVVYYETGTWGEERLVPALKQNGAPLTCGRNDGAI